MSVLLAILGSLALSITCVGVFGTVSYAATLRRKELGIRIALGAGRGSVILTLLKQLIWPLAVGLASGVAAAMLLGGTAMFADRPLYVRPFDPSILASAAAFLITAGVAAVLPAWRALRLDVLQSIRAE